MSLTEKVEGMRPAWDRIVLYGGLLIYAVGMLAAVLFETAVAR